MEMAAAASTLLAITPPSSASRRLRFLSPHLLPRPRPRPSLCLHSTSYNGWDDLAAGPDLPFALPPSHALLPLLLLPVAALSLLPPVPLLAAAFAAGFATRHLAPAPYHSHRLAHLDAQVRVFKDRLPSAGLDAALLLDAVDRLRDAAAALPAQSATASMLGEVADYFGGWARDTIRDLTFSSPRRKPKDIKAAAQPQQGHGHGHGDKHLDSSIHATTNHSTRQDNSLDSAIPGRGNVARPEPGMLPFDRDLNGLDDAGFSAHSTLEDGRLESLVFKHRYGHSSVQQNDPFQGGSFAAESMESSLLERTLQTWNRSYRLKIELLGREGQVSEEQEQPADHFVGFDPTDEESASTDTDGEEFSRNIKEATEILRIARECMIARADEETADALLYKSARLLSTAVALKPTSLVAVGQLGNTYLLHGELKLKISRELRTLLANSGAYLNANGREHVSRSTKLDRRVLTRENISSALVDVCEECESLLVEAGRSYRMAMPIDSGDVKALYNWGLALIFRAQLLADIGPEAAVDADQVYLAAIDKFDAMLSKGNTYAPEALYRWGTVLQQRSHLRSGSGKNKEKIRLLEQAKSMFEDVLYVEANNNMAREALSSCITELNYHGRWL